jgi:hypothetical protein
VLAFQALGAFLCSALLCPLLAFELTLLECGSLGPTDGVIVEGAEAVLFPAADVAVNVESAAPSASSAAHDGLRNSGHGVLDVLQLLLEVVCSLASFLRRVGLALNHSAGFLIADGSCAVACFPTASALVHCRHLVLE